MGRVRNVKLAFAGRWMDNIENFGGVVAIEVNEIEI